MIRSFQPVCGERASILILGTAPSPRSIETGFYYGHAQNRFWKLISDFAASPPPADTEEKRALLLDNGIALWDVLRSCRRKGALDLDIRDAEPNDIAGLLGEHPGIRAVFLNGSAALRFYRKFHARGISLAYTGLPSTSPANARYGYADLRRAWEPVGNAIHACKTAL